MAESQQNEADTSATAPLSIRLPAELREWIERRAQTAVRSRSATVVFYLRAAMARESKN